jgi:hypothetical protein
LVAGLAVATALVGGCSSKHEANDTLPSASETSESPSLEPLGPADFPVPDEARTQDAAGAEAALRYYLDLITHQAAKDGQPLRDLSRDCEFCTFVADRADEDAAAGNKRQGGAIMIEAISPPAIHDTLAEFVFTVGQEAITVVDAQGSPIPDRGSSGISGYKGTAALTWSSSKDAWIVTQLFF